MILSGHRGFAATAAQKKLFSMIGFGLVRRFTEMKGNYKHQNNDKSQLWDLNPGWVTKPSLVVFFPSFRPHPLQINRQGEKHNECEII
jgi:hypothetical protein